MRKITLLSIFCLLILGVSAQNVGVGTATPGTKLDVNGAITLREGSLLISTGATSGIIPDGYSQVLVTGNPGGAFTLTGPTTPTNAGQKLVIYNNTTSGYTGTFHGTAIQSGTAIEFIYSAGNWVATASGGGGATGPTGTAGTNGTNGATGATGSQGAQGIAGPTGAAGTNGTNGATGATGSQGIQGIAGPTGATGTNGTNGATGSQGAQGVQGNVGATGATGSQGIQGIQGNAGPTGATGSQGAQGTAGAAGPTGLTGAVGASGATGPAPGGTGIVVVSGGVLGTPGALTGDVTTSGSGLATTLAAIQGKTLSITSLTSGNILQYNGTNWVNTSNNSLNWALSGNSGISVPPTPTTYGTTAISGNFIGTTGSPAADLVFATTNATTNLERMRILSSGNVGIGTAAPANKLHVRYDADNAGVMAIDNATSGGFAGTYFYQGGSANYRGHIGYVNTGGSSSFGGKGTFQVVSGNRPIVFSANNGSELFNEIARFDNVTGNFGINNTGPAMKLDVITASTTTGDAAIRGVANGAAQVYGVLGTTSSTSSNASGVVGYASGTSGSNNGVWGQSASSAGSGVYGLATDPNGNGIYGYNNATLGSGNGAGVYGSSAQSNGAGVLGYSQYGNGVYGSTVSGFGVLGQATGNNAIGLAGSNIGTGTGDQIGLYTTKSGNTGTGQGFGLQSYATGTASNNYAGYFRSFGGTNNYAIALGGSTSGQVNISPAATTTTYSLTLPAGVGATGQVLSASNGTGGLTWSTPLTSSTAVTTFSAGTTGFTPSSATSGAITLGGILNTANGGMGANMTAGAIGAIPYATSTTAYGTLADVASGSYLRSGGAGAAPLWSTLTLPNTATTGDLLYASGTNTIGNLAAVAVGSVLTSNGTSTAPVWSSLNGLDWTLKGNSGIAVPPAPTTYGTTAITGNFLGTTGSTAADLVFATTNATTTLERMRITSAGKVGIGTAAPSYNFDVSNSTAASVTNIGITSGSSTGTTSANVTGIKFNDWFQSTKLTSEITFDYQGSGLNAYSPAPSVQNASHGLNFISGRSGYDNYMFRDASNNVVGAFLNTGYSSLTALATTDNFVVGGKVGIGLTAPLAPLMVYGGISNSFATNMTGTPLALFDGGSGTSNSRVVIGSNWTATGTRPESVLEFWNNATGGGEGEGAAISTSSAQASGTGNISTSLIFSTSNIAAAPTARMQLWNHATDAVLSLLPSSTGNWARIGSNTHPMAFLTAGSDNSSTTPAMYINTSGQVGINTTSPSSLLYTLSADNSYTTNIATFMALNKTYGVAIAYGGIRPVGTNSSNPLLLDGQGGGSVNFQSQQSGNVVIGDATNNSSPYLLPASSTSLRIGSSTAQCQDIYSNYFYALGKIMIGSTSSPGFPLDIENYITGYTTPNPSYAYGQSGQGPNGSVSSTSQYVSIYAVQNVVGKSFIGFSDARLKNIIGQSKTAEDLNLLRQVKVTDYTMRDLIQNGSEHHKKLIAQELKEVYPIAVKTIPVPQFIPNIYCSAESFEIKGKELTINMSKAVSDTNIKVGVRCKLYVSDTAGVEKEIKGKVSAFTSTQLQIATEDVLKKSELSERLFVYGTEINDLLAVDYEEVSMLNVSATQELAKKLAGAEEHIQLLMAENAKLKTTSTQQADLMKTMKAQLDAISERLNVTTSVR